MLKMKKFDGVRRSDGEFLKNVRIKNPLPRTVAGAKHVNRIAEGRAII